MRSACLLLGLFLAGASLFAHQPNLPPGFTSEETFVSGLNSPTDLKFAPDGRIFITERSGSVRIVENGALLDQPFFTVMTQTAGERGLNGIVLDPDFESNGYVYLYHTLANENRNVIIRVTAAGNTALPGSAVELLRLEEMGAAYHNGANPPDNNYRDPNPVSGDRLNLGINPLLIAGVPFRVKIYDLKGFLLHEEVKVSLSEPESISYVPEGFERHWVSAAGLLPGVYWVKVQARTGERTAKFIRR